MMERFETSLPGYISFGTTWTIPRAPPAAMKSMFGFSAASSGVRPPRASTGQSAIPSPMRIRYFRPTSVLSALSESEHLHRLRQGGRNGDGSHGLGDGV